MQLEIIGTKYDAAFKAELYFAIDRDDASRPFVFGAQSADPSLPAVAAWGTASTAGLDDLDAMGGAWSDWRRSLIELGCEWVIPIIERAQATRELSRAVEEILSKRELSS